MSVGHAICLARYDRGWCAAGQSQEHLRQTARPSKAGRNRACAVGRNRRLKCPAPLKYDGPQETRVRASAFFFFRWPPSQRDEVSERRGTSWVRQTPFARLPYLPLLPASGIGTCAFACLPCCIKYSRSPYSYATHRHTGNSSAPRRRHAKQDPKGEWLPVAGPMMTPQCPSPSPFPCLPMSNAMP